MAAFIRTGPMMALLEISQELQFWGKAGMSEKTVRARAQKRVTVNEGGVKRLDANKCLQKQDVRERLIRRRRWRRKKEEEGKTSCTREAASTTPHPAVGAWEAVGGCLEQAEQSSHRGKRRRRR